MSMRLTLLGTGDAAQIPVYGCECHVCQRARGSIDFRRLPCSALLEIDGHQLLIDSGLTDLAERFPAGSLNYILQTHYHADHVQGLMHLRWGVGPKIKVLGPEDQEGFADLFKHAGILDFSHTLKHLDSWSWQGIEITALSLNHSKPTLGYVFATKYSKIAYLTDTVGLPDQTLNYLCGLSLDCLIIDCSHPPQTQIPRNHNDLNMVQFLTSQLRCQKVVLTHISHQLDLWLENHLPLPENWILGFDGFNCIFK